MTFLVAIALILVGCAGAQQAPAEVPASPARTTAGPPAAARGPQLEQLLRSHQRRQMPLIDYAFDWDSPDRVGAISPAEADKFPLLVRLENKGDVSFELAQLLVGVRLYRDGLPVESCQRIIRGLRGVDGTPDVPPGGAVVTTVGLPCGLDSAGEYEVRTYLDINEVGPAAAAFDEATETDRFILRIADDLPAFRADPATAPAFEGEQRL